MEVQIGPQIKGSIDLLDAELSQWKVELCKEMQRLLANRCGQKEQWVEDAGEKSQPRTSASKT